MQCSPLSPTPPSAASVHLVVGSNVKSDTSCDPGLSLPPGAFHTPGPISSVAVFDRTNAHFGLESVFLCRFPVSCRGGSRGHFPDADWVNLSCPIVSQPWPLCLAFPARLLEPPLQRLKHRNCRQKRNGVGSLFPVFFFPQDVL